MKPTGHQLKSAMALIPRGGHLWRALAVAIDRTYGDELVVYGPVPEVSSSVQQRQIFIAASIFRRSSGLTFRARVVLDQGAVLDLCRRVPLDEVLLTAVQECQDFIDGAYPPRVEFIE